MGNGRLFYFNNDGKLDIYYILKKDTLLLKNTSVLFIEYTEMNCKVTDENGLRVSILLKNMVWYLGVI